MLLGSCFKMIPLEEFLKNCEVGITDLGYGINGEGDKKPILGECSSILPFNKLEDSIRYIVYISNYVIENGFTQKEISDLILHEKLHLYCISFLDIETEDVFIDYWVGKLEGNLSFNDVILN